MSRTFLMINLTDQDVEDKVKTRIHAAARKAGRRSMSDFMLWLFREWEKEQGVDK